MQIWREENRPSVVNNLAHILVIQYPPAIIHHHLFFFFFSFFFFFFFPLALYLICFVFRSTSFPKQICVASQDPLDSASAPVVQKGRNEKFWTSFFIGLLPVALRRRREGHGDERLFIIYPLWSSRLILFPRTSRNSSRAGEVPLLEKMSSSVVWPNRWCNRPNLKWLTKTCSS